MSLRDKQNAMRFGRTYTPSTTDAHDRWDAISGSYSYDGDTEVVHEMKGALERNVEHFEDVSAQHDFPQQSSDHSFSAAQQKPLGAPFNQQVTAGVLPAQTRPSVSEDVEAQIFYDDAPEEEIITQTKQSLSQQEPVDDVIDATKHTILIVDDDSETRRLYTTVFKNAQFNVIEAVDGLSGLDKATKQQPDVVFTGIVMPRMDGFTMIESLKKNANLMDVPVVINSHLGRAQDKKRAKQIGARDFIVRDYTSPREVLDRINDILSIKKYIIPLDLSGDGYETFIADLGGIDAVACVGGKPALELSLTSVADKTFTAKLVCDKDPKQPS